MSTEANSVSISNALAALSADTQRYIQHCMPTGYGLLLAINVGYVNAYDITHKGYEALTGLASLIDRIESGEHQLP